METTEKTEKLLNFVATKFEKEEINNDTLVQLIELCGTYLNIQTIPNYSKSNNMSYNGVKKFRNIIELFNVKFVIDND